MVELRPVGPEEREKRSAQRAGARVQRERPHCPSVHVRRSLPPARHPKLLHPASADVSTTTRYRQLRPDGPDEARPPTRVGERKTCHDDDQHERCADRATPRWTTHDASRLKSERSGAMSRVTIPRGSQSSWANCRRRSPAPSSRTTAAVIVKRPRLMEDHARRAGVPRVVPEAAAINEFRIANTGVRYGAASMRDSTNASCCSGRVFLSIRWQAPIAGHRLCARSRSEVRKTSAKP